MLTIALAALFMLATPVIDIDKDKSNTGEASRAEAPRAVESAAHPSASYNHPYMSTRAGKLWLNLGYGSVADQFDDDGERHDLGTIGLPSGAEDLDARFSTLVLNVGGAYTFYRIGDMNLNGGINFSLAQHRYEADELVVGDVTLSPSVDRSSGLSPQNLTIFGEIERPVYSLRIAYLQDLGSDPNAGDELSNSDRQNALQFGGSAHTWTGSVRVFGGADYFLTLPRDVNDTDVDLGDIANLHAGAGYNWGNGEVGLALLYRVNLEGDATPLPLQDATSGYVFSAVPYVTYAPVGRNFQVSVKGAMQREYYDYGFAIAGRNDLAPRGGVTLGLTYGL